MILAPIYMPVPSEDKWKSIADEFCKRWNFPNCIGAIGGRHVMIQCPFNSGSLFYKSYFSIVLLAVASADYRFVMVAVGAYGSCNDSGVLNHTTFFKQLWNKNLDVPPLGSFLMILRKPIDMHLFAKSFPIFLWSILGDITIVTYLTFGSRWRQTKV